ncbi:hypothetical protein SAMN02745945_02031 [Peptoclostridium litorale DSM 5388]|uniref:Uncharacterized protein n=1 Tax=Peptoclostridium litorale DSM 5388 TaxID=1121324 RepID=A0A069RES5_PEPLI|nr:hypothetical protein [Peptoclostridium litorale]KDR95526.1 hypothetical protein CLIT_10c02530 [Peptoclostridium litorale DSM 5388]SIO16803.1 hypothetical protein SAMN02745945_02031 [Peptoclostridium litorale DSM 5388]
MEELKVKFEALSNDEKVEFVKMIMPTLFEMFMQNPQGMLQEMMPACNDMMKDSSVDMGQMMGMMSMMSMLDK